MITTRISCTNFQNITLGYVVIKKIYQNKNKYLECINFQIIFSLSTLKTLKHESIFKQNMSQFSNKTWVNSQTKHGSSLKQNMSQLSNKTWVNSQTKHESTHKQNTSQLSSKTWVNSQTKHESTHKQNTSQLSNKTPVNSQTKHESTLKQNMSQPSNKTWVNFQSILSFIRCLRKVSDVNWTLGTPYNNGRNLNFSQM